MKLFLDTNFFLHFRDPQEQAWGALVGSGDITLLVCRTVMREISEHAHQQRGRRQDRARRFETAFGDIAETGEPMSLRRSGPRVDLDLFFRGSEIFPDNLTPSVPDDQIVADVIACRDAYPQETVAIVTNDAPLIAKARMFGLKAYRPGPEWRLPPESREQDKELRKLRDENAELKRQGPKPTCSLVHEGREVEAHLSLRAPRRERLSDAEIDAITEQAVRGRPKATDFGPSKYDRPANPDAYELVAVTEAQIAAYQNKYDEWRTELRAAIEEAGESAALLATIIDFRLKVENLGVEPARDLSVVIEVSEGLRLFETEARPSEVKIEPFRSPPAPPRATWRRKPRPTADGAPAGLRLSAIRGLPGVMSPEARDKLRALSVAVGHASISNPDQYSRYEPITPLLPNAGYLDPEALEFWTDEEDRNNAQSWRFTCRRFPHRGSAEAIDLLVAVLLPESGAVDGTISMKASASNLRDPVSTSFGLRLEVDPEDPVSHVRRQLGLDDGGKPA